MRFTSPLALAIVLCVFLIASPVDARSRLRSRLRQSNLGHSISLSMAQIKAKVEASCNVTEEVSDEYLSQVKKLVESQGKKKVRKNILHLSTEELEEFINALMLLKAEETSAPKRHKSEDQEGTKWNSYDKITWHHWDAFQNSIIHSGAIILPWHRSMLNYFEAELQRVSGNPDLMVPYWDWSNPDEKMDIFVSSMMSGNGTGSKSQVIDGYLGSWTQKVADGFLVNDHIVRKYGRDPAKVEADAVPPGVDDTAASVETKKSSTTIVEFLPNVGEVINALDDCYNIIDDVQCLHGMVHLWMGGDFPTSSAPNDPVFYLHHAFVDKLWMMWQKSHSYLPQFGFVGDIDTNLYWLDDYMPDILDWSKQNYVYEEDDNVDKKWNLYLETGWGAADIKCPKIGPSHDEVGDDGDATDVVEKEIEAETSSETETETETETTTTTTTEK